MIGLLVLLAQAVVLPVQCDVIEQTVDMTQVLFGQCGSSGVMIGSETSFKSVKHAPTGAIVAVVRQPAGMKVFLVRPGVDGAALLEDLTADIAKAVGRIGEAGIDDLDLDSARLATDGVLTFAPDAGSKIGGHAGQLSIVDLVANEAARLAQPQPAAPVVPVVAASKAVSD